MITNPYWFHMFYFKQEMHDWCICICLYIYSLSTSIYLCTYLCLYIYIYLGTTRASDSTGVGWELRFCIFKTTPLFKFLKGIDSFFGSCCKPHTGSPEHMVIPPRATNPRTPCKGTAPVPWRGKTGQSLNCWLSLNVTCVGFFASFREIAFCQPFPLSK